MKISNKFLVLALAGLFFVACNSKNQNDSETEKSENESTTKTEVSAENIQQASFVIDGMQCEYGCAKGIEKKLAKLEGIKSAKVDFESKEATIEYDSALQTPQIIAQAVEQMNDSYKVSEIKSSSDQSSVYFDKGKPKAKEKTKKEDTKTQKTSDSSSTDQPAQKKGCCSGKKSCGSNSKTV